MVTLAVERLPDSALNWAVAGPMFGDTHGVALAVGPQAAKLSVPVGDPWAEVPVTVAVSMAVLPTAIDELLSTDAMVGVVEPVEPPVAWKHSVAVLLSLTAE